MQWMWGLATLACGAPVMHGGARDAETAFVSLVASEWERDLREDPVFASTSGDRRYAHLWPDLSPAARERSHHQDVSIRSALRTMPVPSFSDAGRENHALFLRRIEDRIAAFDLGLDLLPVNQRGGIQTSAEVADSLSFDGMKDYENWLARLRTFPAYMEGTLGVLREGVRRGRVHARVVMNRLPSQVARHIVDDPEKSDFYAPFHHPPAQHEPDVASLRPAAREAIRDQVIPAMRRMKHYLETEYLPASLPEIGIWQWPQGEVAYKHLVRLHTTTSLTPDEIHELGLREVARIRSEMTAVMRDTGFSGSLPEFFEDLRKNPKHYFRTSEELLASYRALAKEIDPLLVKLFHKLPRTPYGVSPIPDAVAPDTTTAYYREPSADGARAGTYFVNLYKPEARPKWEMVALTLHEAVPGHHLQIALAMEQPNVPNFRRFGDYTAFVEGWALYAESLGEPMGVFANPYARFGRLTYEMWRAVRLVVDTGIHHRRWTRERAMAFFRENAPRAELDIENEVDRYIAWPGQALAYKVGELTIQALRREAEGELGNLWDLAEFHDVVLEVGAIPLDLLKQRIRAWIVQKKGLESGHRKH